MNFPDPVLQIGFAIQLQDARQRLLATTLKEVVGTISTKKLDRQLGEYASDRALQILATHGLRGEVAFAVPVILERQPSLIGYYRLLLGYSQKQFYTSASGASALKAMEVRNKLTPAAAQLLPAACNAFAAASEMLVGAIGSQLATPGLLHDLSMLTLGAQFRGGANNMRGSEGINAVFAVLKAIFADVTEVVFDRSIVVRNAARRRVEIAIAADPDILITSTMADGEARKIVAIEVKAGEDHSNIWNRIGEAEKSHQLARASKVTECWTIINDVKAASTKLHKASPSTDRFYQITDLADATSHERKAFEARVRDLVGV